MRTNARSLTVFRSRLNDSARTEYAELAPKIAALVTTIPGYIGHKTFTADDGERVTIAEFADFDAEQRWANNPEHAAAMRRGKDAFYADYNIKVCTVDRELTPPAPSST